MTRAVTQPDHGFRATPTERPPDEDRIVRLMTVRPPYGPPPRLQRWADVYTLGAAPAAATTEAAPSV